MDQTRHRWGAQGGTVSSSASCVCAPGPVVLGKTSGNHVNNDLLTIVRPTGNEQQEWGLYREFQGTRHVRVQGIYPLDNDKLSFRLVKKKEVWRGHSRQGEQVQWALTEGQGDSPVPQQPAQSPVCSLLLIGDFSHTVSQQSILSTGIDSAWLVSSCHSSCSSGRTYPEGCF